VHRTEGENTASGLFFGQSSFSNMAVVKGTSALNMSELVKDEEELKLFAPMGCGFQTGAGAVTKLADVGEKDTVAVSAHVMSLLRCAHFTDTDLPDLRSWRSWHFCSYGK
jgi:Zn-dependent alcohol dehydrogenase